MRLINLLSTTDLSEDVNEAPIGDYAMVGNWGDQEKSNSFNHAQDRRIIQSDNLIKKVRKKFGNTDHILNFYFVNLPGAKKQAESGIMTPEQIKENLPKAWELIQQREQEQGTDPSGAINVLYVGNAGFQRVPMTAWIMAHRLGHAMQATNRMGSPDKAMYAWKEFEQDFVDGMNMIFEQVYERPFPRNWTQDKSIAKFFEAIGTMASARNGKLGGRPYEFMYELFAQHVTTGGLTFRELPMSFGVRGGAYYSVRDQDAWEQWSNELTSDHYSFVDQWEDRLENVMYAATGKYLVM